MLALAGLLALTVNGSAMKSTPDLAIGADFTSGEFAPGSFQAQLAVGFRIWP